MKAIKNIVVITGKYVDKSTGEEKKTYQKIGKLFSSEKGDSIKLDVLPVMEGGWSGWANLYDIDESENN